MYIYIYIIDVYIVYIFLILVGEIVHWSPKGDAYAIIVGRRVTVYKISVS